MMPSQQHGANTPKENPTLAARAVALGVGERLTERHRNGDVFEGYSIDREDMHVLLADEFTSDWRVAGALLRRISYGQLIKICVDNYDQLEIRPSAIIRDCVKALEAVSWVDTNCNINVPLLEDENHDANDITNGSPNSGQRSGSGRPSGGWRVRYTTNGWETTEEE